MTTNKQKAAAFYFYFTARHLRHNCQSRLAYTKMFFLNLLRVMEKCLI